MIQGGKEERERVQSQFKFSATVLQRTPRASAADSNEVSRGPACAFPDPPFSFLLPPRRSISTFTSQREGVPEFAQRVRRVLDTGGGGERDGKKQKDERECSGLAAKPCASSFFARVPSAPRPFYVLAPKKVSAFSGSALALHLCSRGKGPSQAVVGAVGGKRRFGLSTRANRCFVFLLGTALSLSSSLLSLPLLSLLLFSLFFSLSR